MPPRSEEEKRRRKLLHQQKQAARRAKKEALEKQKEGEKLSKKGGGETKTSEEPGSGGDEKAASSISLLFTLPEDALRQVLCFLPARELGAVSMTCTNINYVISECRISHLLSRLDTSKRGRKFITEKKNDWKVKSPIAMCSNEAEARVLITNSLEGAGDTGRLITKKSKKKGGKGDADEYIAYARFLEEAVSGYSLQKIPGKKLSLLPPIVNGRFASTSPEHTLCRIGGDGSKSGAGGSGCASWGVGKRGQLGHGKRKDECKPRMLLGGIGYGIRIVQVSAGGGLVRVAHSLLLTESGRVLSFGNAQYGQLGHGYSSGKQLPDLLRPHYIESLSGITCTCVSAGELHSAVVSSDGDLYTWGDGFCGQLGLGDKRPQLTPVQVTKGGIDEECILSVSCGARHTLCVTEDGEVFSFGLGHFGVLGRSFTPYEYHADATLNGIGEVLAEVAVTIAAPPVVEDTNGVSTLSIDDSTRNHIDLLANLTLDDKSDQCIPQLIDALEGITIVGVSAGHRHSIVLDNQGGVYTFGSSSVGALGHGDNLKQEYPMKVMEFVHSNISIIQISAGVDISMAVSTTGDVYAWGKSTGGRIGLSGPSNEVRTPRRVSLGGKYESIKAVDVECGYVHSLIVGLDGTIHICGGVGIDGDEDGQKEDEKTDGKIAGQPTQIPEFNIWHRISEPKEAKTNVKWQKYGKYELKGRRNMMSEAEKWGY